MTALKLTAILLYAYPLGFFLGSVLLRKILIFINEKNREYLGGSTINLHNVGFWIGACEHFLVVTFVLAGEFTALGIIVAARGLLRIEDIRRSGNDEPNSSRSSYYLLGMLLSISFALFFAITGKLLLTAIRIADIFG
ncbi:MAG: hypothetical protein GXO75_06295 [Calditrichaeota bacterium]|nr:hypothetical protein [Calditrichota bacterium]